MPGSTSAIRAGGAFVEIFAEDSQVQRVLTRVQTRLTSFGQGLTRIGAGLTTIGAGIMAPLIAAARIAGEYGGKVLEASQKSGIGIEAIQELGFAAEQTGSSIEGLGIGMKLLQKNLAAAVGGSKESQKLFAGLGLSASELAKLAPEDQLARVADTIASIDDPAKRTAAALKLLGKSGTDLLPLMSGGAAGLAALRAQARELGQVLDADTIRSAEAVGDAFDVVRGAIRATITAVGGALEPVLTPVAEAFGRIAATVQQWVVRNRELIQNVLKVGAVIAVVGAAVSSLGVALLGAGAVAGGFATAWGAIGVVLGALASPIGIAVAAIVGLGAAFIKYTETGQQAFQAVSETVTAFAGRLQESFSAISDALAAGDLALAGKIVWLTIQVEAQRALDFVMNYIRDFQRDAALVFVQLGASITEVWINATTGMKALIDGALIYLYKAMGLVAKAIGDAQISFKASTGRISSQDADVQRKGLASGIDVITSTLVSNLIRELGEISIQQNRDLQDNADARDGAIAEIFADRERKRSAAADELAAAIAELNRARDEATAKREALASRAEAAKTNAAGAIDAKLTSAGTFNPFAVRGLGGNDRLTQAAIDTAKNTKQLVDKVGQGAFGF